VFQVFQHVELHRLQALVVQGVRHPVEVHLQAALVDLRAQVPIELQVLRAVDHLEDGGPFRVVLPKNYAMAA
jgi:hypothetical protein